MKSLLALLTLSAALCRGGTLFMGAYPDLVIVVDEATGKVTDQIKLVTGLPRSLRFSPDKKTIYVSTNDHNGFEVIDVATHKVTNHFVLDEGTHRYRVGGGAPDPQGKFLYTMLTEITKQTDRFVLGKPKYAIVDLAQQKVVKSVDVPPPTPTDRGGPSGFEVSPDGKYLYQFGNTVKVLNATDFSLVDTIQLERPEGPPMENLGMGGLIEALSDPTQRVSIFNYSDPIVHNRVFGLARFDLNTRHFDFTPIGPAAGSVTGLHITPDKKMGYTMSQNGNGGNQRCEFWGLDLTNSKLVRTSEVPCRSRYSFSTSANGQKLYIWGAGFEIEVYDAVTFKHEVTWDLGHDVTGTMLVLP